MFLLLPLVVWWSISIQICCLIVSLSFACCALLLLVMIRQFMCLVMMSPSSCSCFLFFYVCSQKRRISFWSYWSLVYSLHAPWPVIWCRRRHRQAINNARYVQRLRTMWKWLPVTRSLTGAEHGAKLPPPDCALGNSVKLLLQFAQLLLLRWILWKFAPQRLGPKRASICASAAKETGGRGLCFAGAALDWSQCEKPADSRSPATLRCFTSSRNSP